MGQGRGALTEAPDLGNHLPQKVRVKQPGLPSNDLDPIERRNREISLFQKDITRRRKKKLRSISARLCVFVFLPTLLVGWYVFQIATPIYATKSEFLILQADAQGGSGTGGLLTGTQFATSQDSIAMQSYLQSKDTMLRLDSDAGFKSHFTPGHIDPIQRLGDDPTNVEAHETFQKNVKVGYDPTEGVLRMEVIAAAPETSLRFS
jgi:capsular polysaccharide transport system permease protein